ncbi:MAG TPA: hypothetical protein VM100_09995 [Longimicrobiales bacterium]|nr:hypothetical protein [Longimicrobiales bacterium]
MSAILLGVWDSAQSRRAFRLAVTPYVVLDYSEQTTDTTTIKSIGLSNEGVGPAIVLPLEIRSTMTGSQTFSGWTEIADALVKRGYRVNGSWVYRGGEAVGVQRSQTLLRFYGARKADASSDKVDTIVVRLRYKSVYGDEHVDSVTVPLTTPGSI